MSATVAGPAVFATEREREKKRDAHQVSVLQRKDSLSPRAREREKIARVGERKEKDRETRRTSLSRITRIIIIKDKIPKRAHNTYGKEKERKIKINAPTTATAFARGEVTLLLEVPLRARDVDASAEEKRWCWTRCCDDANMLVCVFF